MFTHSGPKTTRERQRPRFWRRRLRQAEEEKAYSEGEWQGQAVIDVCLDYDL